MKTYEESLAEIKAIVKALQEGNISIDQLSEEVGKASELIQYCRTKLRKTGLELEQLFSEASE
ncbi:MAG: exodeoxyribonuclease VII small subunit [Saprospiraceae bacterium]|nr:exodeoxyribonuclease VII small subunit [Saprospiraceae bacterium]